MTSKIGRLVQGYVKGLRARSDDEKATTTNELHRFVRAELGDMRAADVRSFLDEFNHHIHQLSTSSDTNDKKAAVLAIVCLAGVNTGGAMLSSYMNKMHAMTPCSDATVMLLVAKTMAHLATTPGHNCADFVTFELEHALEGLSAPRDEAVYQSAVIILSELASALPAHFYPLLTRFFDVIFTPVGDACLSVRQHAVAAVRAALIVSKQRGDAKLTADWYTRCYEHVLSASCVSTTGAAGLSRGGSGGALRNGHIHGCLLLLDVLLEAVGDGWRQRQRLVLRSHVLHPLTTVQCPAHCRVDPAASAAHKTSSSGWMRSRLGHKSSFVPGSLLLACTCDDTEPHNSGGADSGGVADDKTCRDMLLSDYTAVVDLAVNQLSSRNAHIQQTLMSILPALAALHPALFCSKYMSVVLQYISGGGGSRRDSGGGAHWHVASLLCVALLTNAARQYVAPHVPAIVELVKLNICPIKEGTLRRRIVSPVIQPAVYLCVSQLAAVTAVVMTTTTTTTTTAGHQLTDTHTDSCHIRQLLKQLVEQLLTAGLTASLPFALQEICSHVDELCECASQGLITLLGSQLSLWPTTTITSSSSLRQQQHGSTPALAASAAHLSPVTDVAQQTLINALLAMRSLTHYHIDYGTMLVYVQYCSDNLLSQHHPASTVRLHAVHTTCALLTGPLLQATLTQQARHLQKRVCHVITSLLMVALSDPELDVRLAIFWSLEDRFDQHLAQPANLEVLLLALHDEVFEVRELVLCIVGRLSDINPAYVMPTLRKVLIQLLTQLEYSGQCEHQEQAARLLGHAAASSRRLALGYMTPLCSLLARNLRSITSSTTSNKTSVTSNAAGSTAVVCSILYAISDVARTCGADMSEWVGEMSSLLLHILSDDVSGGGGGSDSALSRREAALHALTNLVAAGRCDNAANGGVDEWDSHDHYNSGTSAAPTNHIDRRRLFELLFKFLRTERRQSIRRDTIRLLGLLGALDPFVYNTTMSQHDDSQQCLVLPDCDHDEGILDVNGNVRMVNIWHGAGMDEFYPAVALGSLMTLIRDPTMSQYHTMAVQAIRYIVNCLGTKCVAYLPQLVPCLLQTVRTADAVFQQCLLQNLVLLVDMVRQHIRPSLSDIFSVIKELWRADSPLLPTLIELVQHVAAVMGCEFRPFMPQLIANTLHVLSDDTSAGRRVTIKLLSTLCEIGHNLADYLHLLLPALAALLEPAACSDNVSSEVLVTITSLCTRVDLTSHAALIIHKLIAVLDGGHVVLRAAALDALCGCVSQLGRRYRLFQRSVDRVLLRHNISCSQYDHLVSTVVQTDDDTQTTVFHPRFTQPKIADSTPAKMLSVSTHNLAQVWQVSNKEDWSEWLRRVSGILLKESPSRPLRTCYAVAQSCPQLSRRLLNAAFVSCCCQLDRHSQAQLMLAVRQALQSPHAHSDVTHTLLNLVEFVEHCDLEPLPIESGLLGERAVQCGAYAKALHHMEREFERSPTASVIETLIVVNNRLHQHEAAQGLLEYARRQKQQGDSEYSPSPTAGIDGVGGGDAVGPVSPPCELAVPERWQERLHNWQTALDSYQRQLEAKDQREDVNELQLGQMRCLEALGRWDELATVCSHTWPSASEQMRREMAHMAAAAAISEPDADTLAQYVQCVPAHSVDGAFYRALTAIKQHRFHDAAQWIASGRDLLDGELTVMMGESYQRAYSCLLSAQRLSELEEMIDYISLPHRRPAVQQMWRQRIRECTSSVEDWQRILHVRSVVLPPKQDVQMHLDFASLCRKHGRLDQCERVLSQLLSRDSHGAVMYDNQHVHYAYIKYMWAHGQRSAAVNQLEQFVLDVSGGGGVTSPLMTSPHMTSPLMTSPATVLGFQQLPSTQADTSKLLARCFFKLAEWKVALQSVSQLSIPVVLQYYQHATRYDAEWYRAWHGWALMNYRAAVFYKQHTCPLPSSSSSANTTAVATSGGHGRRRRANTAGGSTSSSTSTAAATTTSVIDPSSQASVVSPVPFVLSAIAGFVRSVSLCAGNSLQDTLRLLTLWFEYGQLSQVYDTLVDRLAAVRVDNWLQVIPQLIARIDTPRPLIGRLISSLLCEVGRAHPQALVYPLTVAKKSSVLARERAAVKVLKNMMEHSDQLVQQAILVSDELIRVAILWDNKWHEGLEEASRLYFGEKNIAAMFAVLEPLHAMMQRGPETLKERSFKQAYGQDLADAHELCRRYQRTNNTRDLNLAWNRYYQVFRRISRQLPLITTLELPYVSPQLMKAQNLQLAIPGSYVPHCDVIRIASVCSTLTVFSTKQRPRKVTMRGSNGRDYTFLVKGHEDLRQDERVMQLFGLVNTLLQSSTLTHRRDLAIQRFAVVPLSTNSGLIGWVPNSDTMHTLIRDHREKRKVLLSIEHKIMLRMAPDYEHLTLMQKVEVFEHALSVTPGDDLARVLWLRSVSSEAWFLRRANFTRSLAVMSMVGYVLGLGDRHPSNLMLDRVTGKILHIDFGDCFEVAMTRGKFPEKIPFRLTRMLINAMEVTGIEGTYRNTCECVMHVLRRNEDSVLAVLEAFVYDPLLAWRLVDSHHRQCRRSTLAGCGETVEAGHQSHVHLAAHNLPERAPLSLSPVVRVRHHSDMERTHVRTDEENVPDAQNKKAVSIIRRVCDKLGGTDFNTVGGVGGEGEGVGEALPVDRQVQLLIEQATCHQNLCQCYIGWCSFW